MPRIDRQARANEARQRFHAGEKAVALADEYGVQPFTIYRWANEARKATNVSGN